MERPPLVQSSIFVPTLPLLPANGINLSTVHKAKSYIKVVSWHFGFGGPGVRLWIVHLHHIGIFLMAVINRSA